MSNLATITNNILADSGIDDINVVVTNGSYANPSWITSLAWTKITGAPSGIVTGTGTTNTLPKFTGASTIGNSSISDSGTLITTPLTLAIGNSSGATGLNIIRGRLCFSNSYEANHSIYNNISNIDGEGAWDGMKMNVYLGLRIRTGNASGEVPNQIVSVVSTGVDITGALNVSSTATANSLIVERAATRNMLGISSIALPTSGVEEGVAVVKTNSNLWQMSLVGYATNSKGLRVYNTGGVGNISLEVAQGGGTRFIVDGSGSIGMGTSSPIVHSGGRGVVIQGSARGILEIWDASSGKSVFQNVSGDTYIGQLDKGTGFGRTFLLVNGVGSSADVALTLNANTSAIFNNTVTIKDGLIINPFESLLHTQNGTLSYYSTTNAVYLNGAGASGWLRLNAAGTENDINSINIFGSSSSFPNTILFRTNNNTALTIGSSGAATFSGTLAVNGASGGNSITVSQGIAIGDGYGINAGNFQVGAITNNRFYIYNTTLTIDNISISPSTGITTFARGINGTSATFSSSVNASGAITTSQGLNSTKNVVAGEATPLHLSYSSSDGLAPAVRLGSGQGFWDIQPNSNNQRIAFEWNDSVNVLNLLSNGNVGIGSLSPPERLQINGNLLFDTSGGDKRIYFRSNGAIADTNWQMGNYNNPTGATVVTAVATTIDVYGSGGNTYGFMIRNTLNHPLLQIGGGTGEATFRSSAAGYGITLNHTSENLRLKMGALAGGIINIQGEVISSGGVYPIVLNYSGGNVGIGTGTIASKLTIYDGDIRLYKPHVIAGGASWRANINFTDEVDRLGARIVGERTAWEGAPMALGFDTGGVGTVTRRLTITSEGTVRFGSNNSTIIGADGGNGYIYSYSSGNPTIYLEAAGVVSFLNPNGVLVNTTTRWNQERFGIQISNSAGWSTVPAMMRLTNFVAGGMTKITFTDSSIIDGWLGMVPVSGNSYFVMGFAGFTEQGFRLYQNGNLIISGSITATSFFESSDKRLKSNILDLDVNVNSIIAKTYLKNGVKEIGYLAQDVERILPSAVSKRDDGYLDLSYRQVHTAKIAYLEKRINELEQQLKNK